MALSPSIAVRFTADTSDLSKGLAEARGNVAGFAPGATAPAQAGVDGLKASLDGLNATMQEASARSADATPAGAPTSRRWRSCCRSSPR